MNNHTSRVINSKHSIQTQLSNSSSAVQSTNTSQAQSLSSRVSNARASITASRTNSTNQEISFTNGNTNSNTQANKGTNPQEEANFSNFKTSFYKNQEQGLYKLLDQWTAVNDDTGEARAQIAQIRAQINLVNSLENFWSERGTQWKEETEFTQNGPGYAAKDKQLVEDTYKKLNDLENQYDQWGSANDDSGYARAKTAQLMPEIKYHQAVLDVLKQGKEASVVNKDAIDEASFANFKSDFYNAQTVGLGNLMEQWSASDAPGAQQEVGKIRKQMAFTKDATKLFDTVEKFYDKENSRALSPEQKAIAKGFYEKINKIADTFDQAVGSTNNPNLAKALKEINTTIAEMNKALKGKPAGPASGTTDTQGVNPKEEKQFSKFKFEFHTQRAKTLLDLKKQGKTSSQTETDKPTDTKVSIEKEIHYNEKAKNFWEREKRFWNRLEKAGESSSNQTEIQSLMAQLTGLENLMDQNLSNFASPKERAKIGVEILSVKAKIRDLHSNF